MTLKDMLEQYAEHARKSSGLHYVPSFNNNDLCTQDDLVEQEEQEQMARSSVSGSLGAAPVPDSPVGSNPTISPRTSNKMDDWGPQLDTRDIHQVNVHDRTRGARHLFDNAPGSVWTEIIKGEKLKERSFKELDRNNDGYLSTKEILMSLRTTREKAEQMVREADMDGDGRVSEAEYRDVLSRFGSE